MEDYKFLEWLHDRLVHVYGENPHTYFVVKVREMAKKQKSQMESLHEAAKQFNESIDEMNESDRKFLETMIEAAICPCKVEGSTELCHYHDSQSFKQLHQK